MAHKHLARKRKSSRANVVAASLSLAVVLAAVVAATVVHVIEGQPSPARQAAATAPTLQQPVSQEGWIVAVTPTSVTARSVDGFARTYVINSDTNAITTSGSFVGGAGTTFEVNDEVSIVGVVRDGTAVATAVAEKRVSNLDGPPMDPL
ncbi:hypothetical protein [Mycolicibacterium sp. 050158]|uniref:hypothetical protein n=1 Tax=Mycolicibacterium sp. 050158 TaxID=3090602 RepID=UPI00299EAF7B|nr:hypothetical protein [Mycolicibacterium sp. 050158]MDX1890364.1 hypothetical protein [Mycolicibacterium sp. 050158]